MSSNSTQPPDPAPGALQNLSGSWRELHLPWPAFTPAPDPALPAPCARWERRGGFLHGEITCPLPPVGRDAFEKASGFVEGLWGQDLVECFLADSRTGGYVEYNFSPNGHAWWAAAFTAPRVRRNPQPAPASFRPHFKTAWHSSHWQAEIQVPLTLTETPADAPKMDFDRFNLTAVLYTPAGPLYYSLAPLASSRPDFHLPDQWLPLPLL